jgi:hypothetical protein
LTRIRFGNVDWEELELALLCNKMMVSGV